MAYPHERVQHGKAPKLWVRRIARWWLKSVAAAAVMGLVIALLRMLATEDYMVPVVVIVWMLTIIAVGVDPWED